MCSRGSIEQTQQQTLVTRIIGRPMIQDKNVIIPAASSMNSSADGTTQVTHATPITTASTEAGLVHRGTARTQATNAYMRNTGTHSINHNISTFLSQRYAQQSSQLTTRNGPCLSLSLPNSGALSKVQGDWAWMSNSAALLILGDANE